MNTANVLFYTDSATRESLIAASQAMRAQIQRKREDTAATQAVIRASAGIMQRRLAQVPLVPPAKDRRFTAALPTDWAVLR